MFRDFVRKACILNEPMAHSVRCFTNADDARSGAKLANGLESEVASIVQRS